MDLVRVHGRRISGARFAALGIVVLLAFVSAAAICTAESRGQAREGAETLWQEFPLDEGTATPTARQDTAGSSATAATATPTTAVPATETSDGIDGLAIGLLVALALALMGIGAMLGVRARRRAESSPSGRSDETAAADPDPAVAGPNGTRLFSDRTPGGRDGQHSAAAAGVTPAASSAADYPPSGTAVLAYVSDVAPLGGKSKPPGPAEQEMTLRDECTRRGWRLVDVVAEDTSTKDRGLKREALQTALERVEAGEAAGLVVDRLDRLASSASGLGSLVRRVAEADATLVSLDYEMSTASPSGKLLVKVLSGLADWGTEPSGRAAPDALAPFRNRSNGTLASWEESSLRARIGEMRTAGMTLQAIADALNEEGVPTLRGARAWRVSSVQSAAGYKRPSARSR